MKIHSFLHDDTQTYTHVLVDDTVAVCAVIDPVLDYDGKSGHTSTASVDKVIDFVKANNYETKYIIETHAHADHLSAAPHVKQELGGKLVIGKHMTKVQNIFKEMFNLDMSFKTDASQFDVLTKEGSKLNLGSIEITALHVPGHTPADMAYVARHVKNGQSKLSDDSYAQNNKENTQNANNNTHNAQNTLNAQNIENNQGESQTVVFVGDTLFAPDVGTARCDFLGGDAGTLYDSIQKILSLPDDTQIYLCHDYPPDSREHSPVTTVAAQKANNKHVHAGVSREAFIEMREERDATLEMPRFILPSVQVNIRAGELPEPESNGVRYLKIPLNQLT